MGDGGHDPGHQPHGSPNRRREVGAAQFPGLRPVGRLVGPHLPNDFPTRQVRLGQPVQVSRQVLFHLTLGLHDEAQAGRRAKQTGGGTECKAAGVPERTEQTGATAELVDPLLAPVEVIVKS